MPESRLDDPPGRPVGDAGAGAGAARGLALGLREPLLFGVVSLAALTAVSHVHLADFDFVSADRAALVYDGFGGAAGDLWALVDGAALVGQVPDAWHPLTVLARIADRALFGLGPTGFHLHSLAWHLIAVLITAAWLRRAFADDRLAWWAAALFAVWPAHGAAVSLIEQRGVLLAVAAISAGLWALLAGRRCLAGSLLALGLLAHELALVLLLLWPLVRWMREPGATARGALTGAGRDLAALAGGVLAALLVRVGWLAHLTWPEIPDRGGALATAGAVVRTFLLQLGQAWVPVGLSALHPDPPPTWWLVSEWLVVALFVAALVVTLRRRADRVVTGGLLLAALGLSPLAAPWALDQLWADQYLYLTSVGIALVVARLLALWVWPRPGRAVATGALVVALLVAHGRAEQVYRDDATVWARAAAVAAENPRTWRGAIAFALGAGPVGEAATLARAAIARHPNDPVLQAQVAAIACLEGDGPRALAAFAAVHEAAHPAPARLMLQRAGCALRLGRFAEAVAAATEAHALAPWMPDPLAVRGRAYARLGQPAAAEADLVAACRLGRFRRDLWLDLGELYAQQGLEAKAAEIAAHAASLATAP